MAARGPYAKGVAKRAEILDTALSVIGRNGYSHATVKELADAVGLSQNGLLHYFGSKDALFAEILRHHGEALAARVHPDDPDFSDTFADRVVRAATVGVTAPGMSQLHLSLAAAASEADHVAHELVRSRYQATQEVTEGALRTMQERQNLPADADPAITSMLITAAMDGLQMQWLYNPELDIERPLRYLLEALGIESGTAAEPLES